MSERIRGNYDYALHKSTYTLLYFTLENNFVYFVAINIEDIHNNLSRNDNNNTATGINNTI